MQGPRGWPTLGRIGDTETRASARRFRRALGGALRNARRGLGLTLHDVEQRSPSFRPSSLGSYERGDRSISLERFIQLALVYGIPADQLLAEALDRMAPGERIEVVLDLSQLELLEGPERGAAADHVARVRRWRADPPSEVMTLRSGDIQAIASAARISPQLLLDRLGPAVRRRGSMDRS